MLADPFYWTVEIGNCVLRYAPRPGFCLVVYKPIKLSVATDWEQFD